MLPGTNRPCLLPDNFLPPASGWIDVNLAAHLAGKFGSLEYSSVKKIREINSYLSDTIVGKMWNGCNGLEIEGECELSLDATPKNHHFINNHVPKPPARRRYVSVQKYFEERHQVLLNQPHSPLVRDIHRCMYPIEVVWIRISVYSSA